MDVKTSGVELFETVGVDIQINILHMLDYKDRFNFLITCKHWFKYLLSKEHDIMLSKLAKHYNCHGVTYFISLMNLKIIYNDLPRVDQNGYHLHDY